MKRNLDGYKNDMATIKPEEIVHVKGDIINYRGNKQMKVNQIRLATTEDQLKTEQFVDGAPLSPAEIQEEISHYLLDIENANLQRITRHLLKNIKNDFTHIQLLVLIIITLRVA